MHKNAAVHSLMCQGVVLAESLQDRELGFPVLFVLPALSSSNWGYMWCPASRVSLAARTVDRNKHLLCICPATNVLKNSPSSSTRTAQTLVSYCPTGSHAAAEMHSSHITAALELLWLPAASWVLGTLTEGSGGGCEDGCVVKQGLLAAPGFL